MKAPRAEARGHPRILERRAQELLAKRPAVGVVVAIAIAIGLQASPLVLVFQRQYAANLEELTIEIQLLVDDIEAIAAPQVSVEIQVPLQDVSHLVGNRGGSTGGSSRALEAALENTGGRPCNHPPSEIKPLPHPAIRMPTKAEDALACNS